MCEPSPSLDRSGASTTMPSSDFGRPETWASLLRLGQAGEETAVRVPARAPLLEREPRRIGLDQRAEAIDLGQIVPRPDDGSTRAPQPGQLCSEMKKRISAVVWARGMEPVTPADYHRPPDNSRAFLMAGALRLARAGPRVRRRRDEQVAWLAIS